MNWRDAIKKEKDKNKKNIKWYSNIFPNQLLNMSASDYQNKLKNRLWKSQLYREVIEYFWIKLKPVKSWLVYEVDIPKSRRLDDIYPSTFLFNNKIIEMSDKDFNEAMKLCWLPKIVIYKIKRKVNLWWLYRDTNLSIVDRYESFWLLNWPVFNYDKLWEIIRDKWFTPKRYVLTPQLVIRLLKFLDKKIWQN